MKTVTKRAFGKLNLTLDVLGKRPDGYHDMQMLMQSVSLCDAVTVSLTEAPAWTCVCDDAAVPAGDGNLALKAARAFSEAFPVRSGVEIAICKKIPMQAGMAGGSADAAAVLHCLNELCGNPFELQKLIRLAEAVGSDVPYCVLGGTALAEGRGEILTSLKPMPHGWFVLVKPQFSVSTPVLFAELDKANVRKHPDTIGAMKALEQGDLIALCARLYNVFQPVLAEKFPVIDEICLQLRKLGALGSCLTGTGSVVYGVFDDFQMADMAVKSLKASGFAVYLAEPV